MNEVIDRLNIIWYIIHIQILADDAVQCVAYTSTEANIKFSTDNRSEPGECNIASAYDLHVPASSLNVVAAPIQIRTRTRNFRLLYIFNNPRPEYPVALSYVYRNMQRGKWRQYFCSALSRLSCNLFINPYKLITNHFVLPFLFGCFLFDRRDFSS